uniref:Uncharacterized protein n=1 Tax=Glossina pallidipes TaxID=7398 RepID=A0A1B0AB54_GLOPL
MCYKLKDNHNNNNNDSNDNRRLTAEQQYCNKSHTSHTLPRRTNETKGVKKEGIEIFNYNNSYVALDLSRLSVHVHGFRASIMWQPLNAYLTTGIDYSFYDTFLLSPIVSARLITLTVMRSVTSQATGSAKFSLK